MTPDLPETVDCIAPSGKAPYWVLVDDYGDAFDVILPNGHREKRRRPPAAELVEVPLEQLTVEQRAMLTELDAEADREARRQAERAEFFTKGTDYVRHNLHLVRDEIHDPQGRYGPTPDDDFLETVIREQLLTFDELKASPRLPPTTDFWLDRLAGELRKSFDAWLAD